MANARNSIVILTCLIGAAPALAGGGTGWVDFSNETSVRMPTPPNDPATSTQDDEEKDYAWEDFDKDGDTDLVVVRKNPFTSAGGKTNVLFINEGTAEGHIVDGVLVDRTADYVVASSDGSSGFMDETNDRDVVCVDVNGDTWIDLVTATTISDGLPKTISHPRVYINLGEDAGVWQGFEYQEDRIPQLYTTAGLAVAPRFCSVAAGDVTGDGAPDLYFGDYDGSGAGGAGQPAELDLNNRLLVNDGAGYFTDETGERLTTEMARSAFGAASVIADMNNDGANDIVKQTSLASPTHVAITYNDPDDTGMFAAYDQLYNEAPYFVSVGDLNQDGLLDMVIVDDGTDRYLLANEVGAGGQVTYTVRTFDSSDSAGFGGNAFISDLNNDGHNDVLITDVDVDISGCSRRMHIYRNLGDQPLVSFQEQGEVIPDSMLNGTHDVAVFDIDNDGWKDLVVGRCSTTEVWMNQPPIGIIFSYPSGLAAFVTPGQPFEFEVQLSAIGGGEPDLDTAQIHVSVDGGSFVSSPMEVIGKDLLRATLPGEDCTSQIEYFMTADLVGGDSFSDPPSAPAATFFAVAAESIEIELRDDMEGDTSGWTVVSELLGSGEWEVADPNATISGGALASPEDDATAGAENLMAFITENGIPGGGAGAADVDGGPTSLISPAFDLEGEDGIVSYAQWFFCSEQGDPVAEDFLIVEVSNDGTDWVLVDEVAGTDSTWQVASFVVGDYVLPSTTMQVRFTAEDQVSPPASSIVEAGIDNFQVERFECGSSCLGDLDATGDVGFADLLSVLAAWGPCAGDCPQDLDASGDVGFSDLLTVLAAWGPCP